MTIASIQIEHSGDELIAGARSYLYRMLSEAFAFPAQPFAEAVASGGWWEEWLALTGHLPHETALDPPPQADLARLKDAYVSTFEVGVGKPPCPLYEGSHRNGRMKLMEDLVRFYEYFGLQTNAGDHPDHLCAELEFMHYLAFKEAAAYTHEGEPGAARRGQRDFLERHLSRWLPKVKTRLESVKQAGDFYPWLLTAAVDFTRNDLACLKEK